MKAIIKTVGTKLNGSYGVTGTLISNFSESDLKSHVINANARKLENPYHSIVIIAYACDLPRIERIVDDSNVSRQVVQFREAFTFELADLR